MNPPFIANSSTDRVSGSGAPPGAIICVKIMFKKLLKTEKSIHQVKKERPAPWRDIQYFSTQTPAPYVAFAASALT